MTELENVRKQLEVNKKAADRADSDRRRAAKQPAILAYQRNQIAADEYAELVGETYVETQREQYDYQVACAKEQLATKVQGGFLTAEDYKSITGDDYVEV